MNDDKKLHAVKRKIAKGFVLTVFVSYGLPIYRFVKGDIISNCPRVNEEFFCLVLMKDDEIKSKINII